MVDVVAGRKDAVVAAPRRIAALTEHDAVDAPGFRIGTAGVMGMAGERGESVRVLREIAEKTYGPTYGVLRFHPYMEALRGDPEFEALVASLAPKP